MASSASIQESYLSLGNLSPDIGLRSKTADTTASIIGNNKIDPFDKFFSYIPVSIFPSVTVVPVYNAAKEVYFNTLFLDIIHVHWYMSRLEEQSSLKLHTCFTSGLICGVSLYSHTTVHKFIKYYPLSHSPFQS